MAKMIKKIFNEIKQTYIDYVTMKYAYLFV